MSVAAAVGMDMGELDSAIDAETLARAGDIPKELLDPHQVHGAKLHWPGAHGLPFRGAPPDLKTSDPATSTPETGYKAYTRVLELSKSEDMKVYTDVYQLVANGYGIVRLDERHYDTELKSWRVLLSWFEAYAYMPKHGKGV